MKTGILTFQDANNYGAVLQAYALKKAACRYGETDVINYHNPYFHLINASGGFKQQITQLLYKKDKLKRQIRFQAFVEKYVVDSKPIVKRDELKSLNDKYDHFITGSDQVWNLECSGNDSSYFLDFADSEKKSSYAASFGKQSVSNQDEIKKFLCDYRNISVREKSGQKIIFELLSKKIPVVVDPSLLLKKEEWQRDFSLNFEKKYVLVYEVLVGNQLFNDAVKFAKAHQLDVICITSSNKPRFCKQVIRDAGPIEWLRLFAGAAYVFTNSFHGVAFSINFHKQFFVEQLPPPAKTNTRIVELLEKLQINARSSASTETSVDIDYERVDSRLNLLRDDSYEYLKGIVSNE